MSHLIRLSPTIRLPCVLPTGNRKCAEPLTIRLLASRPTGSRTEPVIIRNQSLFDDFVQLANLYQMAGLDTVEMTINSLDSAVDAALYFFCMIEEQYFPLEHMWDWDDVFDNYEGTIRRWLIYIPVQVVGHDQGLEPIHMTEPKALLARLERVGNYSHVAQKHKQVLRCQYPDWEWGDLLDTFQLGQVIEELEEMFLPPPFDKLPALVKRITHQTGTYFLDYTLEHWPHHIQWSKSNLDWLKDDWSTASQILDQSDALCNWLIKNPEELEKIWTILKVAHQRSNT